MKKIIITGGTGFLATHLAEVLKGKYQIEFLCRSQSKDYLELPVHRIDINGGSEYESIFEGVSCIVHCAARTHIMLDSASDPLSEYREVNTIGTIRLAEQAAKAGVKRFIFISSIKVNGEFTAEGKPYSHKSRLCPEDYYGQSKYEAEIELMRLAETSSMEVVVIRPPLIYGPDVKANFESLLRLVATGMPLPFGMIKDNKRSLISVDNLVDLISICINHPSAKNKLFLASDDNDLSTYEMVRLLAKALNKRTWQLPIPIWFLKSLGKVVGKPNVVDRLTGSLQVDISFTKETLRWAPPCSVQDGFKKTASAYLRSKK